MEYGIRRTERRWAFNVNNPVQAKGAARGKG